MHIAAKSQNISTRVSKIISDSDNILNPEYSIRP
jgi:hypothetical protein